MEENKAVGNFTSIGGPLEPLSDLELSDVDDEDQKRELMDLELQIKDQNVPKADRKRLLNRRSFLKSKIKKQLESESTKSKILRLQKKVYYQKQMI